MTNADLLRIAMAQHAIDANCDPADFTRTENVVVISRANAGARKYFEPYPFFCNLISYGSNVVASVDARVEASVRDYINIGRPYRCFETPALALLYEALAPFGYALGYLGEYWLPDVDALRVLPCAYETRVLMPPDMAGLYQPQWHNALSFNHPELDMLGVGAYDGGTLIGFAGCSADCDSMWQIGIDVLPGYRRQGVASALTAQLALEVLARGKAPFYCCAWSNLASVRNAIRSGFRPVWVELETISAQAAKDQLLQRFQLRIEPETIGAQVAKDRAKE